MKKFLLAAAGAAALSFAAASADAAIFVSASVNGGASTTLVSGGDDLGVTFLQTIAGWRVQGSASSGVDPDVLTSNTLDLASAGAGFLDVYVTRTGIAGPIPATFFSSFTSNSLPATWTVLEETRLSDTNAIGGGALLSSATFTAIGTSTAYSSASAGAAGPYSVTEHYRVTSTGAGSANSTIVLQTAVPEPATWAFMILGFGGAGAMLRSRRRAVAAAA